MADPAAATRMVGIRTRRFGASAAKAIRPTATATAPPRDTVKKTHNASSGSAAAAADRMPRLRAPVAARRTRGTPIAARPASAFQ
jgi:hypothetical protein